MRRGVGAPLMAGALLGERGTTANSRVSAVLSDTVLFSSNLIGEFRLSYTRNHSTTTPSTLGFDFSTLGIGAADPGLKANSAVSMLPRIEVGRGYAPLGMSRAGLIDDTEGATELQGHATWVKSGHTWKGGLNISKMSSNVFRPEYPSGQYVCGAGYTQGPNPSAAFIMFGLPPVMGMRAGRTTVVAGFLGPIAAVGYNTWVAFANLATTAGGDHA